MSYTQPSVYLPQHLQMMPPGPAYPLTSAPLPPGTPINFTPPPVPRTLPPINGAATGPLPYGTGPTATASRFNPLRFARGGAGGAAGGVAGRAGAGGLINMGGRIGLVRGLGYGLAAEAGDALIGDTVGGDAPDTPGFDRRDVGQFLSGAGRGAALGAGIGSVIPVAGTAVGAGVGAVAGGLAGAFDVFGDSGPLSAVGDLFSGGGGEEAGTGTDLDSAKKMVRSALRYADVSPAKRDALRNMVMQQLELAPDDATRSTVLQNAAATIGQVELGEAQARDQLVNSLAMQAQAAQIFAPFAEQNERTAQLARSTYDSLKSTLPQSLHGVADMFATNAQMQADAMTQGLYTTALAQPRIDAMVAQQQQVDSMAAQIVQQAQAMALQGGAGGGAGVDIEALLAEAG